MESDKAKGEQQQPEPQQVEQPAEGGERYWLLRKLRKIAGNLGDTIKKEWNIEWADLTNYNRFVNVLYRPTDPSSLGIARALFGLCMVIDVVEERGLADIDLKWGDSYTCHFPLIHGMRPLSLAYMILLYTIMWMGAFGIMLGFCFKLACACFVIPYWYIHILDKSYWNNHSYLYGLVALLFWGTGANRYFSLDAYISETPKTVPFWNYFILKFQFFALYFFAGLKKCSIEWLSGHSMSYLSDHWVFFPFKLFLSTEQIDFYIIHWFGFIFDLTIGFWLLFDKTRVTAMVFCTLFHLMNSRLFSIGMFPYTCLATMGLFCKVNWPKKLVAFINFILEPDQQFLDRHVHFRLAHKVSKPKPTRKIPQENHEDVKPKQKQPEKKQQLVVFLLILHIVVQCFLPYSHFITKGYNNWVPGIYGYSWDMMVHNWNTILVVIRVHDNVNNKDHFVDPMIWVPNEKWTKHGDMIIQYAQCAKHNLLRTRDELNNSSKIPRGMEPLAALSDNVSIYMDVRCSLNGRFQQRIFNPNVDMLRAEWHPLMPVKFLMPLLNQYTPYRQKMEEITKDVYSWSEFSDVIFVADYPGMSMENYLCSDFTNVTLTILQGHVLFSQGNFTKVIQLHADDSVRVGVRQLHQIMTISPYPSCYMLTFTNRTRENMAMQGVTDFPKTNILLSISKEIIHRVNTWRRAVNHITNVFFHFVYNVPLLRRVPRVFNFYRNYY